MIAEVLVLFGAVLTLLSAAGVVRFGDVLARMHALTKASTLGVLLAVIGYALGFGIGKAVKQEPAPRSTQEPSL